MTIIFGYFQYLSYEYLIGNIIPSIINAVFYIILNFFIIKSSRTQPEEKVKPRLLFNIGRINIIFLILPFIIPAFITVGPTPIDIIIEIIYVIFLGLIRTLPFLITYGLMMFKYGTLNQERFNIYLKLSGIIWIITYGFNTLILDSYTFSLLFSYAGVPGTFLTTFMIITSIFGFIGLIGWVLFIVHAIKNKDTNLLIAGIIYFVAFIVVGIVYSSFIPSLLGY